MIEFTVIGEPAPQGSKTRTRYGVREDNPRTRPWRATVAAEAAAAMIGKEKLTGPVRLDIVFAFHRPSSHYGTGKNAGKLKESASDWKASSPDLDKLVRAVGDALAGIVYHRDGQVCDLRAVEVYGPTPGCSIRLTALPAGGAGWYAERIRPRKPTDAALYALQHGPARLAAQAGLAQAAHGCCWEPAAGPHHPACRKHEEDAA